MQKNQPKNIRLVVAMAERGLANSELAQMAGMNPSHLSATIRQRYEPRPLTMGRIARALQMKVIDLFPGGAQ
jgi:DNA-binding phage protein